MLWCSKPNGDRGHLRAHLHPQRCQPLSGDRVGHRPARRKNAIIGYCCRTDNSARKQAEERCSNGSASERDLQQRQFSSIATDAKGVIQIFNVGAERMLGYALMNDDKITPATSPTRRR